MLLSAFRLAIIALMTGRTTAAAVQARTGDSMKPRHKTLTTAISEFIL